MRKRATDSTVLETIGGRGSFLSGGPYLRSLFTCMVVALGLGGGAPLGHALNGESGEQPDFEGAFQPSSCQNLRAATGLADGDEIFACDSDGEQCRLFSATSKTNEGVALGFCEVESVVPTRDGVVHRDTGIAGTAFGATIGISSSAGDIFCETFETTSGPSPGKKVCVRIFQGNCTGNACEAGDGSIVVRSDDCNDVRALLAVSVTGEPLQNLRWWLFTASARTGQAGSEVLTVCNGNAWSFISLSGQTIATHVGIDSWGNRLLIHTPHTTYLNGVRYCKRYSGEPANHCP